ncbi:MAG: peptidoglycan-binding protein, partial [Pseudomonadota bacterium]
SSGDGQQGTVRPDLQQRSTTTERSENGARSNTTSTLASSTLSGRGGDALDVGKFNLPILQLGSSDRAVGLLQRALALLGSPSLSADGTFGLQTDQAVRAFQDGSGLTRDGIVGNRQTWPAINQALVTRHEGMARLADAMGALGTAGQLQAAEMKQVNAVLAEIGERAAPSMMPRDGVIALERQVQGVVSYTVRGGETLADVARTFGLPISALIAANPELAKPYLILQGQLLTIPNPAKERRFRRPPRQLHPADPDGHLASVNMNPDFVALINGMIGQLRSEGYDVRVIAGYRSFAEQQQRFEQGRRAPGRVLTDVEGGHSWHNYGLAVDIVLNDDEGRPAWPEDSNVFWQRLGDAALAHGAVWGGLFGYPAHIEYHPQFERDEAGTLIEDFEGHGLEAIWERIALELPTEV